MPSSEVLLVVNADDFGFTPDVNAGIVAAYREGILTATTLMANGAAFADAVRCAEENPGLDIGAHLVLVQGPGLPATIPELLVALARGEVDPYREFSKQIRKILAAGLPISHLDTHKHTHLAPPVFDGVLQVAREFGIRWVRRPVDFPMPANSAPFLKRCVHIGVKGLASLYAGRFAGAGCCTTDFFTGFQVTGQLDTAEMVKIIRHLPGGLTELMCHPGFLGEQLRVANTRLKESRAEEFRALVSPEVRAAMLERGVRKVNYRELSCPRL